MADNVREAIQRVYDATWRLAEENDREPLFYPDATRPKPGFAILYTPLPSSGRADLLICGQNPSNFSGDGDWSDETNRTMLSGAIPEVHSYVEHQHVFARVLQGCFSALDMMPTLAGATGMNIWHLQTKGRHETIPPHLAVAFEKNSMKVVMALRPKVILAVGMVAFDVIRGGMPEKNTLRHAYSTGRKERYYSETQRGVTKVFGVGHVTGSSVPDDVISEGMLRALTGIRELL